MSEEAGGIFGEAPSVDPTIEREAELDALESNGELVPDAPDGDTGGEGAALPPEQPTPSPARGEHPTVPLPEVKALREEKARIAAELQAANERWARLEERFLMAQRAQQAEAERRAAEEKAKQQAQQDPPPDPNEDPDGYREWQLREIQRRQDAYEAQQRQFIENQQRQAEQQQVQARLAQFSENVVAIESRYAQQRPDYPNAVTYVGAVLRQPLELAGWSEQAIQEYVNNVRWKFLDSLVRVSQGPNGELQYTWLKDPADELYSVAQRLGYQTPGAAPPPPAAQQNGNGQAAPQIQPVGGVPEAPAQPPRRVQMRQQGVAAAQQQAPGGQPADAGGALTLDRVVAMDLPEFAWWQANNPEALKRAMGG